MIAVLVRQFRSHDIAPIGSSVESRLHENVQRLITQYWTPLETTAHSILPHAPPRPIAQAASLPLGAGTSERLISSYPIALAKSAFREETIVVDSQIPNIAGDTCTTLAQTWPMFEVF